MVNAQVHPPQGRGEATGPAAAAAATRPAPSREAGGGDAPGRPGLSVAQFWRMIVRWRWLVGGAAGFGLALGLAAGLLAVPVYRGVTTIEINDEPTQVVQVGQVQPPPVAATAGLGTQIGLLASRSLAERVTRDLDLADRPGFVDPALPRAVREAAAAGKVAAAFAAEPVRDSRLVRLEFDNRDPALAAQVADGYADGFIAANLQRRFETTAYARDFLQGRIATVKGHLEASERALVAYARRQGIVDVATSRAGDATNSLTTATLVGLNAALTQAETDRIAAEERLAQAGASAAGAAALGSPVAQGLRTQLADLESQARENGTLFRKDYPAMIRLRDRIAGLRASLAAEGDAASGSTARVLLGDYRAARAREERIAARVEAMKAAALDLRDRSIRYTILQREVDTNRILYDGLLQRFKEVSVAGGVGENLIAIVDRAQVPGRPISPNLPLDLAMGLAAGLLAGVAAALAREVVSDVIETPDDVEEALGLRTLGIVPRFPRGEDLQRLLAEPRSPLAEAYQSAAGALRFATADGIPRTLLVTSARAAEGKSSSALALAQAVAASGPSVLLIDADLRKPTFGMEGRGPAGGETPGLSDLLAGGTDPDRSVHPVRQRLALMPSGPVPPSPAELLSTDRFAAILAHARASFDVVVIDAPPVLGLADAPLMAASVAGVVIVLEAGAVRAQVARAILSRLRGTQGNVIGAILTKVAAREVRSGYGYGADYGGPDHGGAGGGGRGRDARPAGGMLRLPSLDGAAAPGVVAPAEPTGADAPGGR